jgi:adenylosuccinate synthase
MCTSYEVDGRTWERIVPGPWRDLDHQERITAALSRARMGANHRPGDWAAEIGDVLDAPVVLESSGPRSSDKRVLSTLGKRAAFSSR